MTRAILPLKTVVCSHPRRGGFRFLLPGNLEGDDFLPEELGLWVDVWDEEKLGDNCDILDTSSWSCPAVDLGEGAKAVKAGVYPET
jgi:hypothetical protein